MREPIFETTECESWDEDDWERFLQVADARAAKFEELFETLLDHPRREQIIAHEMGWEEFFRECRSKVEDCDDCGDRFECEAYEMLRLMEGPDNLDDDPEADELIACFDEVKGIPAYAQAYAFSLEIEQFLREHFSDDCEDDDLRSALLAAAMAPAQIAGGHGIGYDRESLCGNIANCKRALKSLQTCSESLDALAQRDLFSCARAGAFRQEAESVRTEIARWIENLRARVWWR